VEGLPRRRGTRRCALARGTLLAYPALCLRGIGARGPLVGKVYRNAHLDNLPPTHKTARTALQRHMRGYQPNAQPALRTAHEHDQLRSERRIGSEPVPPAREDQRFVHPDFPSPACLSAKSYRPTELLVPGSMYEKLLLSREPRIDIREPQSVTASRRAPPLTGGRNWTQSPNRRPLHRDKTLVNPSNRRPDSNGGPFHCE
jgi:hypothetical protein